MEAPSYFLFDQILLVTPSLVLTSIESCRLVSITIIGNLLSQLLRSSLQVTSFHVPAISNLFSWFLQQIVPTRKSNIKQNLINLCKSNISTPFFENKDSSFTLIFFCPNYFIAQICPFMSNYLIFLYFESHFLFNGKAIIL
jgi:hypothetical protein